MTWDSNTKVWSSILLVLLSLGLFWLIEQEVLAEPKKTGKARVLEVAQKVLPGLKRDLVEVGAAPGDPVFIRIFKEERELELWIQPKAKGAFKLLRTYQIAAMSGRLGPKLAEGDRQAPEGFYYVKRAQMNPNSRYHLAFNIGYPNRYDRLHDRTGSFIMVHGAKVSIGCFAMTDPKIEEIYTLCDLALANSQSFFRVHSFPFRMSSQRMLKAKENRWFSFWQNLREGYVLFERDRVPPNVEVGNGFYVFP